MLLQEKDEGAPQSGSALADRMPGSSVKGRSARSIGPSRKLDRCKVTRRLGPRVEAAARIGHSPWHASGLLQRDVLAAAGPVRQFAKVADVEFALPGRLIAHATGRGGLGFRLRAFYLGESIRFEHILKAETVTRRRFLCCVAG